MSLNLSKSMLRFHLVYEDVDESSAPLEVALESHCTLDAATAAMIRCNMNMKPPGAVADLYNSKDHEELNYNVHSLEDEFLRHCREHVRVKSSTATTPCVLPTSDTNTSHSPLAAVRSQPSVRQSKGRGVRSMGGIRRKKAKTLSYAKDDS